MQVLPRRGVLICPISADDIREIYDVLIAVEGMAAARLAELPKPRAEAITDELEQATAAMELALASGDLPAWAAADERFHQLLTDRCGNRRWRGSRARYGPSSPLAALHVASQAKAAQVGHGAQGNHRRDPTGGPPFRRGGSTRPPQQGTRCAAAAARAVSDAQSLAAATHACLLPGDIGRPYRAVVAHGHQDEQLLGQIA